MVEDSVAAVVGALASGLDELALIMERHGFTVARRDSGKASGGYLASADFEKQGRKLHLWLRRDALSVRYEVDGHELEHTDYMRELLGPAGGNRFPSYSENAAEAFAALRDDLQRFGGDFLAGPGDEYMRCWRVVDEERGLSGPQRLARIERRLRER